MDDYFDDDYMDDELDDCYDAIDICEEELLDDSDEQTDIDETHKEGISFEEFLFWGGFLGMNIDEERI